MGPDIINLFEQYFLNGTIKKIIQYVTLLYLTYKTNQCVNTNKETKYACVNSALAMSLSYLPI